jgi:ABC-type polar amino acid transport system ATPase subunit
MPVDAALIAFVGVNKHFGRNHVLRDVSLRVAAGDVVAVIGPSGSGKSTLVRSINHLEAIQAGTLHVAGVEITGSGLARDNTRLRERDIARFRAGIGMVFQSFNLFPHLSVLGNLIEAPVGVLRWSRDRAHARAEELLRKVGLSDKLDARPAQLSGGQQQRVAIARALMMDPPIMLFDEPTSALDPELKGEVLQVISDLALAGRTSIIVTHEFRFAREVATHLVFMEAGQIIEAGPIAEVMDAPREARTRDFLSR